MEINKLLDSTLLRPDINRKDINSFLMDAFTFKFRGIIVPPYLVKPIAERYGNNCNGVRLGTVIGFPFGYSNEQTKISEAFGALVNGALDIDYVLNISYMMDKEYNLMVKEIMEVGRLVEQVDGGILKIIAEVGYLSDPQLRDVCQIIENTGVVDFIKTSTGYGPRKTRTGDIRIIRESVSNQIGIKASGGIKTLVGVRRCVRWGADIIGTSNATSIMEELKEEQDGTT
jgi:deoxyribose-phosphate aldolase